MTADVFEPVEKMIKNRQYDRSLSLLLNGKSGRINRPYNTDLNHAWYLVGLSYYKLSNYSDALEGFRKSYRHWNEDIAAIRAIGNCLSELKKPRQAKYYFTKALAVGGEEIKDRDIMLYNLGNAYFDLEDYESAIDCYRKVSEVDQESYKLALKNIKHAEVKIRNR